MKKGDIVRLKTTGQVSRIDAVVSDNRGELFRLVGPDAWFDDRYLELI